MASEEFLTVDAHDGRFFAAPGVFRFVEVSGGRRRVLHEEETSDIAASAGPRHPRWSWALSQGLTRLEIRLRPSQARQIEGDGGR